jgi:hypothetical protein
LSISNRLRSLPEHFKYIRRSCPVNNEFQFLSKNGAAKSLVSTGTSQRNAKNVGPRSAAAPRSASASRARSRPVSAEHVRENVDQKVHRALRVEHERREHAQDEHAKPVAEAGGGARGSPRLRGSAR